LFQFNVWAFGGDLDYNKQKNDAQFCLNGLVFPDRSPKPAIYEAKYLMQPFVFTFLEKSLQIKAVQRYPVGFEKLEFRFYLNSSLLFMETCKEMSSAMEFNLAKCLLNKPINDELEQFIHVSVWVEGGLWLSAGEVHKVAWESFPYSSPAAAAAAAEDDDKVSISKDFTVKAALYSLKVNSQTGSVVSFISNQTELLVGPSFTPVFTRACVDNDLGGAETMSNWFVNMFLPNSVFSYSYLWKKDKLNVYDETYVWPSVTIVQQGHNSLVVTRKDATFQVIHRFTFLQKEVTLHTRVELLKTKLNVDSLPRIGTLFHLIDSMNTATYCGRGPFENYPDRQSGASLGIWEAVPRDDFYVPYVFPSENGGRSQVTWVEMNGVKWTLSGGAELMSISPFNISELEKAKHQNDLCTNLEDYAKRSTKLILDYKHMGVAGDMSWMPCVHDAFKIQGKVWEYEIRIALT
jgi:beta-galactosidase